MTEFTTIEENRYGTFSVFRWDTWPAGSLLAGQNRKRYVVGYPTEEIARERFPEAEESTSRRDPHNTFNHLPDEDEPVPGGMYPDDIGFHDDDIEFMSDHEIAGRQDGIRFAEMEADREREYRNDT